MRHMRSVLLPLVLLGCSIGAAAAENVCVQAADGAIVCGPIANRSAPSASPWDQPRPKVAEPAERAAPAPDRRELRHRAAREAERDVRPAKHAYRQPPPRELDRRPPPRRIAREDARRLHAERDRRPPPRVVRVDRDVMARQYDMRLRELEREVRALRAGRDEALRRVDRRPAVRPPYRERDIRRHEHERDAALRRVSHKDRERNSADD